MTVAASAALIPVLPVSALLAPAQPAGFSPVMAARRRMMREALASFDIAFRQAQAAWARYEESGLMTNVGITIDEHAFWDWHKAQPPSIACDAALDRACAAVEAVFMTPPESVPDDDAVLEALSAYAATVAPSAFAARTARDLFTPYRHQSSPAAYDAIRDGLLTDPEEAFAKSDMPWFLKAMRKQHRKLI